MKHNKYGLFFITIIFVFVSCKKLIDVPPPVGLVTAAQVFSSDDEALAATTAIYYNMINGTPNSFANYPVTIYTGLSSDELLAFNEMAEQQLIEFQQNNLTAFNSFVGGSFWNSAYSTLYNANAVIEGLEGYSGVGDSVKNELFGEAKFIRAFCHFYLVNLFGDVPLVTSVNWHKTSLLSRTPAAEVYNAILRDLREAKDRLPDDYRAGNGQRIVPNKWACAALLSRIYLYQQKWDSAEAQATALINNSSLFILEPELNNIFLTTSKEAIWQLQQSTQLASYNATPEGFQLVPFDNNTFPLIYLSPQLLNDFEPGDKRRIEWVDTTHYQGADYYYPYKYKLGPGQARVNGPYIEYYTIFRLAEQYLIRAEARAMRDDLSGATADLNLVRNRAGLTDYTAASQSDLLAAIAHERRIELFAEWGHRWFDLKRTGQATNVLSPIKPLWDNNDQLYPIPVGELVSDPNLTQNPGYE